MRKKVVFHNSLIDLGKTSFHNKQTAEINQVGHVIYYRSDDRFELRTPLSQSPAPQKTDQQQLAI